MLDYSKRKCYGFVKNNSEDFIINEAEAQNVKLIFECFLKGMSLSEIANELYSQGIPSPYGKDTWSRKVISSVLSNEKYYLYGIISNSDFESVRQSKAKRKTYTSNKEMVNESKIINTEAIEETNVMTVELAKTNIENFNQICYYAYNNISIDIKSAVISTFYGLKGYLLKLLFAARDMSSA